MCLIYPDHSEPEDGEVWNEDEAVICADLCEDEPDFDSNMETVPSTFGIFSWWLLHFLMYMQAVFHLSDVVITNFLQFFRVFFTVLGWLCAVGTEIAQNLPSSLYLARKHDKQLQFRKYVVCKKCHRIYYLSDCVEGYGRRQSKVCCFRRFPSHPQPSRRAPCGAKLLKTVEMASGRTYFYPFLTYCYLSLEVSIQSLLKRPNFFHLCEQWKQREVNCGMFKDVYDGKIWKKFMCYSGQPFLS